MTWCRKVLWILGLSWSSVTLAGSLYSEKDVELLALDGEVLTGKWLMAMDLPAGEHQIVFRYSKRMQDGGREVSYMTPPLVINVTTLMNDEIELLSPQLNTLSQAELYFANHHIWRVKWNNGAIKTTQYSELTQDHQISKKALQPLLDDFNQQHQTGFFDPDRLADEGRNELLKSVQLLFIQANEQEKQQIKAWVMKQ